MCVHSLQGASPTHAHAGLLLLVPLPGAPPSSLGSQPQHRPSLWGRLPGLQVGQGLL